MWKAGVLVSFMYGVDGVQGPSLDVVSSFPSIVYCGDWPSRWCVLGPFVMDDGPSMWAEFWALCPVSLAMCLFLFSTVLVTVASPDLVWSQGGRCLQPVLSQGHLGYLGSFVIHTNVRRICTFCENYHWKFRRDCIHSVPWVEWTF